MRPSNPKPLERGDLEELRARLVGRIFTFGDFGYDEARSVFNPRFDYYPIAVIYCENEADVLGGLEFARRRSITIHIRSGGHSGEGFSIGEGLVLDLSALDSIVVDDRELVATVGCGCSFLKLNAILDRYNLHVPGGQCEGVCIGGFVQGGGFGFTSRIFGMCCDNVIDMRVMLADGRVVIASEQQNYDLWWALRGGTGGNFGVLISVRLRLWPLEAVFAYAIAWCLASELDRRHAVTALLAIQNGYMGPRAPSNMSLQPMMAYRRDLQSAGTIAPYLMARGVFLGTAAEGERALAPLRSLPGAVVEFATMNKYSVANRDLLNRPQNIPDISIRNGIPKSFTASRFIDGMLESADWLTMVEGFVASPNTMSYAFFEIYGGAIADYPLEESAFVHRSAALNACLSVFWHKGEDEKEVLQYANDWCKAFSKKWNGRIYQNYPDISATNYCMSYWGEAFPALSAVKKKYDGNNFFSFAQSIPINAQSVPDSVSWPPRVKHFLQENITYRDR